MFQKMFRLKKRRLFIPILVIVFISAFAILLTFPPPASAATIITSMSGSWRGLKEAELVSGSEFVGASKVNYDVMLGGELCGAAVRVEVYDGNNELVAHQTGNRVGPHTSIQGQIPLSGRNVVKFVATPVPDDDFFTPDCPFIDSFIARVEHSDTQPLFRTVVSGATGTSSEDLTAYFNPQYNLVRTISVEGKMGYELCNARLGVEAYDSGGQLVFSASTPNAVYDHQTIKFAATLPYSDIKSVKAFPIGGSDKASPFYAREGQGIIRLLDRATAYTYTGKIGIPNVADPTGPGGIAANTKFAGKVIARVAEKSSSQYAATISKGAGQIGRAAGQAAVVLYVVSGSVQGIEGAVEGKGLLSTSLGTIPGVDIAIAYNKCKYLDNLKVTLTYADVPPPDTTQPLFNSILVIPSIPRALEPAVIRVSASDNNKLDSIHLGIDGKYTAVCPPTGSANSKTLSCDLDFIAPKDSGTRSIELAAVDMDGNIKIHTGSISVAQYLPPLNLTAGYPTENSIPVAWDRYYSVVDLIRLEVKPVGATQWINAGIMSPKDPQFYHSYRIPNLSKGTTYEIRAVALSGSTPVKESNIVTVTTAGGTEKVPEFLLAYDSVSDKSIKVRWNAFPGAEFYALLIQPPGAPSYAYYLVSDTITGTSHEIKSYKEGGLGSIKNLKGGTSYKIKVLAESGTPGSFYRTNLPKYLLADSNTITVKTTGSSTTPTRTPDPINPTISTSLTPANPTTGQTITITATAYDANSGLSETKIYIDSTLRKTCAPPFTYNANSVPICIFNTSYTAAGTHTYYATAKDNAGNSAAAAGQFTIRGKRTLTVSKSGTGSGTITSSPAGIVCGTTCSADFVEPPTRFFDAAYNVNLTATPASNSTFSSWSGNCDYKRGRSCIVYMATAHSVTATFSVANIPPSSTFTVDKTSGTVPLTVAFTSTSSDLDGTITSHEWYFGDTTTRRYGQAVSYTYYDVGSFIAQLTVADNNGTRSGSAVRTITVTAPTGDTPPIAAFTVNATSGDAPLTVTFSSTSTDSDGTIASYYWDFGDYTTGTGNSVSHTYTEVGSYSVRLIVTDNGGATASTRKPISATFCVNPPPALAKFCNNSTGVY